MWRLATADFSRDGVANVHILTMRIPFAASIALLASACASNLPLKDVDSFISRRDLCDHLRGEVDGGDTAAQQEVISQTDKACAGTDAELARLKRQYADSPKVMGKLNNYEAHIESHK